MNPITLALVGLPIVIGFVLRFVAVSKKSFLTSVTMHATLFGLIGIGYTFATYGNSPTLLVEYAHKIFGWGMFFFGIVSGFVAADDNEDAAKAVWSTWIFGGIFYFVCSEFGFTNAFNAAATMLIFFILTMLNVILGTIATGFAIASLLNSYLAGADYREMMIWKDVFRHLGIETDIAKIISLFGIAFLGAFEKIVLLFERKI
jgi:hypothetical protein